MSITDADFTFPATANAPPRLLDSPPLWHSYSTPSCYGQGKALATNNAIASRRRKSFSYVERGLKGDDDEEEDKMDMLWEDFNDSKGAYYHGSGMKPEVTLPGRVEELGCAGALNKLSKAGGGRGVFSGKKPSAVVLVKVLKRLFMLHNYTRRSVKKPTW